MAALYLALHVGAAVFSMFIVVFIHLYSIHSRLHLLVLPEITYGITSTNESEPDFTVYFLRRWRLTPNKEWWPGSVANCYVIRDSNHRSVLGHTVFTTMSESQSPGATQPDLPARSISKDASWFEDAERKSAEEKRLKHREACRRYREKQRLLDEEGWKRKQREFHRRYKEKQRLSDEEGWKRKQREFHRRYKEKQRLSDEEERRRKRESDRKYREKQLELNAVEWRRKENMRSKKSYWKRKNKLAAVLYHGHLCEMGPLSEHERNSLCNTPRKVEITLTPLRSTSNLLKAKYMCFSYDPQGTQAADIFSDGRRSEIPPALLYLLQATRLYFQRSYNIYAAALSQMSESLSEARVSSLDRRRIRVSYVKNASATVCWLGDYNGRPLGKAVELLKRASQGTAGAQTVEHLSSQSRVGSEHWSALDAQLKDTNLCDGRVWETIKLLFESSYWNSNSCIIDIVPSKKTLLFFGICPIELHEYIQGTQALLMMPEARRQFGGMKGFAVAQDIFSLREKFRKKRTIGLDELLRIARRCTFTDPREMVWDMIPLCMPPLPSFSIDVPANIPQVFIEAATCIIMKSQCLKIWHLEAPPCAKSIQDLPS
ncbi:hypothetical protein F5Y01DRAFT_33707 [Xylaria sp. FL0043]|nr:hypothetical protein F5Y01DRAFT_33707 [Xylaria sp. FL0043]